jgi:catechol 2,3-dioxygenase-like lactoylglutathione lyase family enzyme
MAVELNHTIVASRDKEAAASFVSEVLGLPAPGHASHFVTVSMANGVTLDFDDAAEVHPQHYAFMVGAEEYAGILARVRAMGISFWGDPGHRRPGETYDRSHDHGFYFEDPSGHNLEVLTHG